MIKCVVIDFTLADTRCLVGPVVDNHRGLRVSQ